MTSFIFSRLILRLLFLMLSLMFSLAGRAADGDSNDSSLSLEQLQERLYGAKTTELCLSRDSIQVILNFDRLQKDHPKGVDSTPVFHFNPASLQDGGAGDSVDRGGAVCIVLPGATEGECNETGTLHAWVRGFADRLKAKSIVYSPFAAAVQHESIQTLRHLYPSGAKKDSGAKDKAECDMHTTMHQFGMDFTVFPERSELYISRVICLDKLPPYHACTTVRQLLNVLFTGKTELDPQCPAKKEEGDQRVDFNTKSYSIPLGCERDSRDQANEVAESEQAKRLNKSSFTYSPLATYLAEIDVTKQLRAITARKPAWGVLSENEVLDVLRQVGFVVWLPTPPPSSAEPAHFVVDLAIDIPAADAQNTTLAAAMKKLEAGYKASADLLASSSQDLAEAVDLQQSEIEAAQRRIERLKKNLKSPPDKDEKYQDALHHLALMNVCSADLQVKLAGGKDRKIKSPSFTIKYLPGGARMATGKLTNLTTDTLVQHVFADNKITRNREVRIVGEVPVKFRSITLSRTLKLDPRTYYRTTVWDSEIMPDYQGRIEYDQNGQVKLRESADTEDPQRLMAVDLEAGHGKVVVDLNSLQIVQDGGPFIYRIPMGRLFKLESDFGLQFDSVVTVKETKNEDSTVSVEKTVPDSWKLYVCRKKGELAVMRKTEQEEARNGTSVESLLDAFTNSKGPESKNSWRSSRTDKEKKDKATVSDKDAKKKKDVSNDAALLKKAPVTAQENALLQTQAYQKKAKEVQTAVEKGTLEKMGDGPKMLLEEFTSDKSDIQKKLDPAKNSADDATQKYAEKKKADAIKKEYQEAVTIPDPKPFCRTNLTAFSGSPVAVLALEAVFPKKKAPKPGPVCAESMPPASKSTPSKSLPPIVSTDKPAPPLNPPGTYMVWWGQTAACLSAEQVPKDIPTQNLELVPQDAAGLFITRYELHHAWADDFAYYHAFAKTAAEPNQSVTGVKTLVNSAVQDYLAMVKPSGAAALPASPDQLGLAAPPATAVASGSTPLLPSAHIQTTSPMQPYTVPPLASQGFYPNGLGQNLPSLPTTLPTGEGIKRSDAPSAGSSDSAASSLPTDATMPLLSNKGLVTADVGNASLMVVAPPLDSDDTMNFLGFLDDLINKVDADRQMVELTVAIVDVDTNKVSQWGNSFALAAHGTIGPNQNPALGAAGFGSPAGSGSTPGTFTGFLNPSSGAAGSVPVDTSVLANQAFSVGALFVGSSFALLDTFSAMEGKGQAHVLYRPSILTANNSPALVSDLQTRYLFAGGLNSAGVIAVPSGLTLNVVPQIFEDADGSGRQSIRLQVDLDDEPPSSAASTTTTTTTAVAINAETSHIQTNAVITLGQSLLIAGRLRHQQNKSESRVPVLGSIPVLGRAFKTSNVQMDRSQRLVMITPAIVDPNDYRRTADAEAQLLSGEVPPPKGKAKKSPPPASSGSGKHSVLTK